MNAPVFPVLHAVDIGAGDYSTSEQRACMARHKHVPCMVVKRVHAAPSGRSCAVAESWWTSTDAPVWLSIAELANEKLSVITVTLMSAATRATSAVPRIFFKYNTF